MNQSEVELIEQLQQGEPEAFRRVVDLYQDMVYNTVLSIVQNEADAEDNAGSFCAGAPKRKII